MNQKRCIIFGAIASVLLIILLWFGFTVPVRLSVKQVTDTVYAGDKLSTKDFTVKTRTLFGIGHYYDRYSIVADDGNFYVNISVDNLQTRKRVNNVVKATELIATYDGSAYVGQPADINKVTLTAKYEDGTSKNVENKWIYPEPVGNSKDKYKLNVDSPIGNAYADVDIVKPDSMNASYGTRAVIGDKFKQSRVVVKLHYPDNTEYQIHDFVISDSKTDSSGVDISYRDVKKSAKSLSYPSYFSKDVTLFAISPYGAVSFEIHPEEMDAIVGHYADTVYVGDKLDKNKVSVTMTKDGKKDIKVTDYLFTSPGYVTMDMSVRIPTRYGIAKLKLEPVKIKDVSIDTGDTIEGQTATINGDVVLTYNDGTQKSLKQSDVKFLNKPDTWSTSQKIWMQWHGCEFSVTVNAVPKKVADLRDGISLQQTKYKASNKVIKKLALICRRAAGDDLEANSYEIALMLNRYEAYGNGDATGQGLLDYVLTSGYWGDAEGIESSIKDKGENDDIDAVIRDAVCNGYRRLPSCVDERLPNAVESIQSSSGDDDIQLETTMVRTSSGKSLYLYVEKSGNMYCSSSQPDNSIQDDDE